MIAPGAEMVGQAQILTELGKPFELAGLFGAADAGAFGGADEEMVNGEEDVLEEPELMDEDGSVSSTSIFFARIDQPMFFPAIKWNLTILHPEYHANAHTLRLLLSPRIPRQKLMRRGRIRVPRNDNDVQKTCRSMMRPFMH